MPTNAETGQCGFHLRSVRTSALLSTGLLTVRRYLAPSPLPTCIFSPPEKLGVAPANCIVFEDSPVGILAARAAGARVAGILTTATRLDRVDFAVADFLQPELEAWLSAQCAL